MKATIWVEDDFVSLSKKMMVKWWCVIEKEEKSFAFTVSEEVIHKASPEQFKFLFAQDIAKKIMAACPGGCYSCEAAVMKVEKALNVPVNPASELLVKEFLNKETPAAPSLSTASLSLPGMGNTVSISVLCRENPACYCPCDGPLNLRIAIMHLNDIHRWTREQIADWLDSIDDPENGMDLAFKVPGEKEGNDV